MNIEVNGEERRTEAGTIEVLVAQLGHEAAHVATALNGDFVPRPERAAAFLKDGDRVEILAPMQGG